MTDNTEDVLRLLEANVRANVRHGAAAGACIFVFLFFLEANVRANVRHGAAGVCVRERMCM